MKSLLAQQSELTRWPSFETIRNWLKIVPMAFQTHHKHEAYSFGVPVLNNGVRHVLKLID